MKRCKITWTANELVETIESTPSLGGPNLSLPGGKLTNEVTPTSSGCWYPTRLPPRYSRTMFNLGWTSSTVISFPSLIIDSISPGANILHSPLESISTWNLINYLETWDIMSITMEWDGVMDLLVKKYIRELGSGIVLRYRTIHSYHVSKKNDVTFIANPGERVNSGVSSKRDSVGTVSLFPKSRYSISAVSSRSSSIRTLKYNTIFLLSVIKQNIRSLWIGVNFA